MKQDIIKKTMTQFSIWKVPMLTPQAKTDEDGHHHHSRKGCCPFTDPARAAVCPQQAPVKDSNRCSCRWSEQRSLWELEGRNNVLPKTLLEKVFGRCSREYEILHPSIPARYPIMVTTVLPGSQTDTDFLSPRAGPGSLPHVRPMGFAMRLTGERDILEGVISTRPFSPTID